MHFQLLPITRISLLPTILGQYLKDVGISSNKKGCLPLPPGIQAHQGNCGHLLTGPCHACGESNSDLDIPMVQILILA